jgi:Tfp pilus assembly protein PilX
MLKLSQQQNGFILLIVVIFMQIIALLTLSVLANTREEIKFNQLHNQRQKLFFQTEAYLHKTQTAFKIQDNSCVIAISSSNALLAKKLSWWQSHANCHESLSANADFYWVVELIATDPCAQISSQPLRFAQYFRLSGLGVAENGAKVILQSTFIKADNERQICRGLIHHVNPGVQSWSEIG